MIKLVPALAVAAALLPGAAHADYAAIAFSQEHGAVTYSYSAKTKRAADDAALKRCRKYGPGCFIAIRFWNSCGSIAVGSNWGYGVAYAGTREDAAYDALANCQANDDGCKVRQRVCSG